MLLHIGVGYVNQRGPSSYVPGRNDFDVASLGLTGMPYTGVFPRINGLTGANNTGGLAALGQATAGSGFGSAQRRCAPQQAGRGKATVLQRHSF